MKHSCINLKLCFIDINETKKQGSKKMTLSQLNSEINKEFENLKKTVGTLHGLTNLAKDFDINTNRFRGPAILKEVARKKIIRQLV
jgi:hypothetical protein